MGKKKQETAKAAVGFAFAKDGAEVKADEERTVTLKFKETENVTIRFRVPRGLAPISDKIELAGVASGGPEAAGEAMSRFILRYLVNWSLEPYPSIETFAAMTDFDEDVAADILFSIYEAIKKASREVKNA